MAELTEAQKAAVSKHLKNIFQSNELPSDTVLVLKKATMFCIWASLVLKEFIIKAYVMDDERLREPENFFGKDFFEEQLERICDIRSSGEHRFYQKIADIYSQCNADYKVNSPVTKDFLSDFDRLMINVQKTITLQNNQKTPHFRFCCQKCGVVSILLPHLCLSQKIPYPLAPHRILQLPQSLGLDLPDPLPGDVERLSDLLQSPGMAVLQAEPQHDNLPLPLLQIP